MNLFQTLVLRALATIIDKLLMVPGVATYKEDTQLVERLDAVSKGAR